MVFLLDNEVKEGVEYVYRARTMGCSNPRDSNYLSLLIVSYSDGMLFLSNVSDNAPSMWMAIGMMAALVVYGFEYYLTRPSAYKE